MGSKEHLQRLFLAGLLTTVPSVVHNDPYSNLEKDSEAIVLLQQPPAGAARIEDKSPEVREGQLSGMVICLDPGHDGEHVPGASARDEKGRVLFDEHELTLEVATRLKALLEGEGAEVCVTRNEEGSLQIEPQDFNGNGTVMRPEDLVERAQPRIDWMRAHNPDIVLSVHFNGFNDSRLRGTEVYFSDTGPHAENNQRLAHHIILSLIEQLSTAGLDTRNRGVKSDNYKTEYLEYAYWYGFDRNCQDCKKLLTLGDNPMSLAGGNWQAGALIEVLFLSNPEDVQFLRSPNALDVIAQGLFRGIVSYVEEGKSHALPESLPPQEIVRGNTERPEMAITFDCGPWVNRSYIDRILDILDRRGTQATFFVTGIFIEKHPEVFERIARTHELANHSYSHPNFVGLSPEEQKEELRVTEELAQIFGVTLKPLWRAPFGARTPPVLENAA